MKLLSHIIILQISLGQVLSNILMCVNSSTCSCKYLEKNEMQVECADSYTVKAQVFYLDTIDNNISIECNSDKKQDWRKHFNQTGEFGPYFQLTSITFSKCQMLDTNIEQIFSKLGIKKVHKIRLIDVKLNGSLRNTYFSNLNSVISISISKSHLELTNKTFEGTPYLKFLNLPNNNIEVISKGVFNHLTDLSNINLAENNIINIDSDIFDGIPLKMLDLSDNDLTNISLNIQSLNYLYINQNLLTHFEPEELNLPVLKELHLSHNKLSNLISKNVFLLHNLVNVEYIDLSHNYINFIDPGWSILTNLYSINLSNNNFTILRLQEFQYINGIRGIYLDNNPLEEINLSGFEAQTPPGNMSNNIELHLSSDKLICDCRNYEFARFIQNPIPLIGQNYFQITENLICYDGIPFSNVKLENLTCDWKMFEDIDKTDCFSECECTYRPHHMSALMNCSNRNLTLAPEKIIFSRNLNYSELNLSHNSITTLPQYEYFNIKKLNIGYNNLNTINISQLPKNLMELHLENNSLTMISEANDLNHIFSNMRILTMRNNPWICTCDAKDTFDFIQKYSFKITDLSTITCNKSPIKLYKLTTQDVCEYKFNTASIITVSMFLAVLSLLLFFSLLRIMSQSFNVKVWLYYHNMGCLISEESLDQDKKYDVFLSYSHKDQDLVANHLLPGLEEGIPSFKVCIHERDWIAGEFIPAQIARSVEESRRTIVVLSKHFVDSVWGRTELRAAYTNALSEKRNRIIVIRYGDVSTGDLDLDLRKYMSMNTYLQWEDSRFWDRLRYALQNTPRKKTKSKTIVLEELN